MTRAAKRPARSSASTSNASPARSGAGNRTRTERGPGSLANTATRTAGRSTGARAARGARPARQSAAAASEQPYSHRAAAPAATQTPGPQQRTASDWRARASAEGEPAPTQRFNKLLLEASAAALAEVLAFDTPADRVLSRFFREHPKLGQNDRSAISETIYAVLRRKRLLDALIGASGGRRLVLAAWLALRGANLKELQVLVSEGELGWVSGLKRAVHAPQPYEVDVDLPDWLIERLGTQHTPEDLLRLAKGLQQPAPLDLRVNLIRITREEALAQLNAAGVLAQPTPYSPAGIRLVGKPAINRHPLFVEGLLEVQDEGSQLIAWLMAPQRSDMVVDFCAGAGGKTLALGMLMRSTGRLYAFDVSDHRLAALKPRLARSGLSNVHPQRVDSERDPRIGRLAGKIDRVLVDAPCSGLGTLRRNPDLKWRQKPGDVKEMVAKQTRILASAARLPRAGGRLVYATCSLLAEENRGVVDAFLAAHPDWHLVPVSEVLGAARIPLPEGTGDCLELRPDLHGTDGFFAAVLERR
jgi:16S rRNA (cytosine967-C5)-methyltransferase